MKDQQVKVKLFKEPEVQRAYPKEISANEEHFRLPGALYKEGTRDEWMWE